MVSSPDRNSRTISKVCRKVVKKHSLDEKIAAEELTVNSDNLEEYSGVRKYTYGVAEQENRVGQVTGLAWTQVGGELLTIESAVMPGKGRVIKTGSLGDVMQESIQAALTVVRNRAKTLGINDDFYEKNDIDYSGLRVFQIDNSMIISYHLNFYMRC